MTRLHPPRWLLLAALVTLGSLGCSDCSSTGGDKDDGGPDATDLPETGPEPRPEFFPEAPVFEGDAPTNARGIFEMEPTDQELAAAPCVVTPQSGTIYPRNWLRPRVEFTPAGGHDLYEIVFRVQELERPLRVYTTEPETTLSAALWHSLRFYVIDEPVEVSIRSARTAEGGTVLEQLSETSVTHFTIAPVAAPGEIVYWALPGGYGSAGVLKGFQIGDEGVVTVLDPGDVVEPPPQPLADGKAICIGCHTATPDGSFVGLSTGIIDGWVPDTYYRNTLAGVRDDNLGDIPAWMNAGALAELKSLRGLIAFSEAYWDGDQRIALLSHDGNALHALNLAADVGPSNPTTIARTGDANEVTSPAWSHDGQTIVYSSISGSVVDGRPENGPMDLYTVPYGSGAGGAATPLEGASEPNFIEYYPAFSPDDRFVAFTRASSGRAYDNPNAEIFIVPREGGTAIRLNANDPAECASGSSPGITNSWPKWSPEASSANGKTYYFLTFSSMRRGDHQLFVATVVVDGDEITTSPALHLWNQPEDEGNHTPAWEHIQIPIFVPG
jgi:hypothetical protein